MDQNPRNDGFARAWEWVGSHFARRPTATLGIIVGLFVAVLIAARLWTIEDSQNHQLREVTSAFCSSRVDSQTAKQHNKACRQLFDELLKHPTPEQARRLRVIVKGQQ